jgi:hypothetical protein
MISNSDGFYNWFPCKSTATHVLDGWPAWDKVGPWSFPNPTVWGRTQQKSLGSTTKALFSSLFRARNWPPRLWLRTQNSCLYFVLALGLCVGSMREKIWQGNPSKSAPFENSSCHAVAKWQGMVRRAFLPVREFELEPVEINLAGQL